MESPRTSSVLISPARMSKSRSKACKCCIAAKRKCGREFPVCHRCNTRNLECVYDNPPIFGLGAKPETQDPGATRAQGSSTDELFDNNTLYDLDSISFDLEVKDFASSSSERGSSMTSSTTSSLSSSSSLSFQWFSPLHYVSGSKDSTVMPLMDLLVCKGYEVSMLDNPPYIKKQKCVSRNGIMVSEERGRLIGILGDGICHAMNSKEISFATNWFRNFPLLFCRKLYCPLIGPNLYDDFPPVLSSALAICSLAERRQSMSYEAIKMVEASLENLIIDHFNRFNYDESQGFPDKLAFIQAASLLQAIALYSGNVSLCGVGETNIPYVMSLYEDGLSYIRENQIRQTDNWVDWKLVQNAELAVFMGFMLQNLYLLMKKSTGFVYSFNGKWMSFCSYTSIWAAKNEHEWREAMSAKPLGGHLLLCNTANVILDPEISSQTLPDSVIVMGLLFGFEQVERCLKIRSFTDYIQSLTT